MGMCLVDSTGLLGEKTAGCHAIPGSLGNVSSQATIASSNSAEWLPTGTIHPQIEGKVTWHLWASGTEPGMNNYQGQCLTR
jgi:hypothetical protein